jgi:hypothetical protein
VEALRHAAQLVDRVIHVDDFDADLGVTDALAAASERRAGTATGSEDVAPVRSAPPRRAA